MSSASDPTTEIAECINGFQSARDQISEQTESLLHRRQKSSTRLLGVKARELRLGAHVFKYFLYSDIDTIPRVIVSA